MDKKQIYEDLQNIVCDSNIYIDEPMSKHTSFKIGGYADIFIKVKTRQDLENIIKYAKNKNIPITITGNGSNMLVRDKGIRGITLQIAFNKTQIREPQIKENRDIDTEKNEIEDEVIVEVESGKKLGELSANLQKEAIAGFEFASGIPGTIGGAIKMNAGAYGKEMKDIVKTITYMDEKLQVKKIQNEDALFSYRHSRFSNSKDIILSVELKLQKGDCEQIKSLIDEYRKSRIEKQPVELPSAGSTFKRGDDFITAKLIDEAGLKGYKIGGAQVSLKHAGFVVNTGDATAQDVLQLVEYIKNVIYNKFGKNIELEVEVVGE